jgi:hypothetical protein
MIDLTWYLLGLLAVAATVFLWSLSKKRRLNWLAWTGLSLGIVLVLFSIAWAVASVTEGVPRSAAMGLLLFGLGGIVVLTVTWRYIQWVVRR